jgi:GNAT superfamily N-acetyltransferase
VCGIPGIALRDLRHEPDAALLLSFYDDVLKGAFSPEELDEREVFEAGLASGHEPPLQAAVAVDAEGRPVGGVTAERFTSSGVLLVGYVAVRPEWRGRGLGSLLMRWASTHWYEDPSVVLVLGEVHDPRHQWDAAGEDTEARIRFFRRLGAQVLGVSFVQPSLGPGLARVPHFLLVAFAVKPAALVATEPPAVDPRLVAAFVRDYFEYCEGPIEGRPDPQLAGLLAAIEERPGLPLLPLDRYADIPPPRS